MWSSDKLNLKGEGNSISSIILSVLAFKNQRNQITGLEEFKDKCKICWVCLFSNFMGLSSSYRGGGLCTSFTQGVGITVVNSTKPLL